MYGQGSPTHWLAPSCWRSVTRTLFLVIVSCCAFGSGVKLAAETTDVRLRISWGGSEPRQWRGQISIQSGALSEIVPLGLDADQPGSYVQRGNEVLVNSKMPHRYDGLEVLVTAGDLQDVLSVQLAPADAPEDLQRFQFTLEQIVRQRQQAVLDDRENQLFLERAPGDKLRVDCRRESLVFTPGEEWRFDLQPHLTGLKAGSPVKLKMRLRKAGKQRHDVVDFWTQDNGLWSHDENLRVAQDGSIGPMPEFTVRIPAQEGVYELAIALALRPGLATPFALGQLKPALQRTVQFVVVESLPRVSEGESSDVVTEFNPAEPSGLERLAQLPQWKLLPVLRRGPWNNQPVETWHDDNGAAWTRVPQNGWVAYSLPVSGIGKPHVVDIQLPSGLRQSLGISILDASATGELAPIGLDSGVTLGDTDLGQVFSEATATSHRLVFWPRTQSPLLLFTNRNLSEDGASFGRIRLEVFPDGLPTASPSNKDSRERYASMTRQLLLQNFLAPEATSGDRRFSIEDWTTFYESGKRFVAYLRYAGYDGALLTVSADGSALYPSRLLQPTPKFDRGIFFDSGQDPLRKDVVELLFRLFDREGLTLVPSIDFSTPLPALEYELASDKELVGIELRDVDGRKWVDEHSPNRGKAPYYNILDARVQSAMLSVVDELINRYARHDAFGGIQVRLDKDGFDHLPDHAWGLDEHTLRQYHPPHEKTSISDLRTALKRELRGHRHGLPIQQTPSLQRWLDWRANRVARFYQEMANHIQLTTSGRLFLSTTALTGTDPWRRNFRPVLPRRPSIESALAGLGLSTELLQSSSLVALRPQVVSPPAELAVQAAYLETNRSGDVNSTFRRQQGSATQYYFSPHKLRLESFDQQGPFHTAYTFLLSHFEHGGFAARQPYAQGLAARDDLLIVDGGDMLVMGQEHELRPFFDVYRRLPRRPFQTHEFHSASPVVVRSHSSNAETVVYLLNNAPWQNTVELEWVAPEDCRTESLGSHVLDTRSRDEGSHAGRLAIEPFGLAAFRFDSAKLRLLTCVTYPPPGLSELIGRQREKIASRIPRTKQPENIDVLNDPGFESPLIDLANAGWTIKADPGSGATIDEFHRADGNSSLRLHSEGGTVVAISNDFAMPKTGRLSVTFRMRADDTKTPRGPRILAQLESDDGAYHPVVTPGLISESADPNGFREYIIHRDDIPVRDSGRLRLVLAMTTPGRIWIDKVATYDKLFLRSEQDELHKILQDAYTQHDAGDLGGCYETLNGYWPRFLLRHIEAPRDPVEVAQRPRPSRRLPPPKRSLFDPRRYIPDGWF